MAQEDVSAGPSASKMKKVISKMLELNNYNPDITLGQIRSKLQRKLGEKCPGFDFSSAAFKAQSRGLIQEVVHAHEDAVRSGAKSSSGSGEAGEGKKKKRVHSDNDGDSSVATGATGNSSKKVKVGGGEGANLPSSSSTSSHKTNGDAPTQAKEEEGGKKQETTDPRFTRLSGLAKAMNLVPAIYHGFGEMDMEEKIKALRTRLKEKGAEFDSFPSRDQIKAAEVAQKLKQDLEGIDSSNIVTGSRRGGGSGASTATDAAATSSTASLAAPAASSKKKRADGDGGGSSSEDEMEL
jgi:hypothetical protein